MPIKKPAKRQKRRGKGGGVNKPPPHGEKNKRVEAATEHLSFGSGDIKKRWGL